MTELLSSERNEMFLLKSNVQYTINGVIFTEDVACIRSDFSEPTKKQYNAAKRQTVAPGVFANIIIEMKLGF